MPSGAPRGQLGHGADGHGRGLGDHVVDVGVLGSTQRRSVTPAWARAMTRRAVLRSRTPPPGPAGPEARPARRPSGPRPRPSGRSTPAAGPPPRGWSRPTRRPQGRACSATQSTSAPATSRSSATPASQASCSRSRRSGSPTSTGWVLEAVPEPDRSRSAWSRSSPSRVSSRRSAGSPSSAGGGPPPARIPAGPWPPAGPGRAGSPTLVTSRSGAIVHPDRADTRAVAHPRHLGQAPTRVPGVEHDAEAHQTSGWGRASASHGPDCRGGAAVAGDSRCSSSSTGCARPGCRCRWSRSWTPAWPTSTWPTGPSSAPPCSPPWSSAPRTSRPSGPVRRLLPLTRAPAPRATRARRQPVPPAGSRVGEARRRAGGGGGYPQDPSGDLLAALLGALRHDDEAAMRTLAGLAVDRFGGLEAQPEASGGLPLPDPAPGRALPAAGHGPRRQRRGRPGGPPRPRGAGPAASRTSAACWPSSCATAWRPASASTRRPSSTASASSRTSTSSAPTPASSASCARPSAPWPASWPRGRPRSAGCGARPLDVRRARAARCPRAGSRSTRPSGPCAPPSPTCTCSPTSPAR